MKIVVVGAGGHGLVVVDILRAARGMTGDEVVAVVDDDPRKAGTLLQGIPVVGSEEELTDLDHEAIICAIGDNESRRSACERLRGRGEVFGLAVHPSTTVAEGVSFGEGTMVCAGVIVNPETEVGSHTILNTACTIDHHNVIGAYTHVAPGAHLGGNCSIGDMALVGLGASVLPGRVIGTGAVVGAGAVVVEDVPAGVTVVGNPARPVSHS